MEMIWTGAELISVPTHQILSNYRQHADNFIACDTNDMNVIIFYNILSVNKQNCDVNTGTAMSK